MGPGKVDFIKIAHLCERPGEGNREKGGEAGRSLRETKKTTRRINLRNLLLSHDTFIKNKSSFSPVIVLLRTEMEQRNVLLLLLLIIILIN